MAGGSTCIVVLISPSKALKRPDVVVVVGSVGSGTINQGLQGLRQNVVGFAAPAST